MCHSCLCWCSTGRHCQVLGFAPVLSCRGLSFMEHQNSLNQAHLWFLITCLRGSGQTNPANSCFSKEPRVDNLFILPTFFWITYSRNIPGASQSPNTNQRSMLDAFLILTGPISLIICGEVAIICWSWHIKILSPPTLKVASYLVPQ